MDETREDLHSMLPFLPLVARSSSLFWPSRAIEVLKDLSKGPGSSAVRSGAALFDVILKIRDLIGLSEETLDANAAKGYGLFFDDLISAVESKKWFEEVIPSLANLLLKLPSLFEEHYGKAGRILNPQKDGSIKTGLRLLGSQEAGIVFLSQELIGALLSCSFFCLFPVSNRSFRDLLDINFDKLFGCLYSSGRQSQEHKLKCIKHYFDRICACLPTGCVSFERKVLPIKQSDCSIMCPETKCWSKSLLPLCSMLVVEEGLIEDQQLEAIEVDFANQYIGGGALRAGCVQEVIRFMINPELIVSMLFMPSMAENEAIEIVGAERFSNYKGYASSFVFLGDCVDMREADSYGRRKTRIVAIDALCCPGRRQYQVEWLLRETNKAFCGFLDPVNYQNCQESFQKDSGCKDQVTPETPDVNVERHKHRLELLSTIGIATGNWGCGAFGGDPEIKSIIQWIASSQAGRPFILYYTFKEKALLRLEEVSRWILLHEWSVGDLWNILVEYSFQRLNGHTDLGFFDWLLPPHGKLHWLTGNFQGFRKLCFGGKSI